MNVAYTNWKNNYEAEFEEHRQKNYRLIYRYQSEYKKYVNDPEWIQVGDFCNFHRRGTLHIGEQITAKYEKLMLNNINVFKGFCEDEFNRVCVFHDYNNAFESAKKIFGYRNMKIRYEDLTTNQRWAFKQELNKHLQDHDEEINILRRYEDLN